MLTVYYYLFINIIDTRFLKIEICKRVHNVNLYILLVSDKITILDEGMDNNQGWALTS